MNAVAETAQSLPQGVDYIRFLPETVLSISGLIVMVLDPLVNEEHSQKTLGVIALIGTLAALAATIFMSHYPWFAFWNMIRLDLFSVFFHLPSIIIAALVILTSYAH